MTEPICFQNAFPIEGCYKHCTLQSCHNELYAYTSSRPWYIQSYWMQLHNRARELTTVYKSYQML